MMKIISLFREYSIYSQTIVMIYAIVKAYPLHVRTVTLALMSINNSVNNARVPCSMIDVASLSLRVLSESIRRGQFRYRKPIFDKNPAINAGIPEPMIQGKGLHTVPTGKVEF